MKSKSVRWFIYIFLIFYFSLFFSQKINLTNADLGRHITNGKYFFKNKEIISTNFYSYTQPDFSVVNHHWLSGPIFYLINETLGFKGLSLTYMFFGALSVFFIFLASKERSSFIVSLTFTLIALPLISVRREIRPEIFSYFFLALYVFLFEKFRNNKIKFSSILWILFLCQIIWVNVHIFFIMGLGISFIYFISEILFTWPTFFSHKKNKEFLKILVFITFASLINPHFFGGLIEPLYILREYGYMIIENQSVFFLQKRFPSFNFVYFHILTSVSIVFLFHILFSKKIRELMPQVLLMGFFTLLSYRAIRGFPMFGIFFIFFVSSYFGALFKKADLLVPKFICLIIFIFSLIKGNFFAFVQRDFGIGLLKGVNDSADFFNDNNIKGPVFNNYDIGGYLIYHFSESEKVFVDNRPEAYSVSFFEDIYVPMQEDEQIWKQSLEEYDFNVIYFYRLDATPWAQPFLIKRLQEEQWVPIYVDDYVLILLRNLEKNRDIINAHELPENLFVITKI